MTKVITVPKLLEGEGAISKAIASITTRGKKLDADIQHCALSILAHVEAHGNVTLVNDLYNGMPKGSRKAALTEWLLKFGKVVANTDPASKKLKPFLHDKTRTTNLVGAVETPWFEFKPDVAPDVSFDYYAMLMAVMAKGEKAAGRNGVEIKGASFAAKVKEMLEAEMAEQEALAKAAPVEA